MRVFLAAGAGAGGAFSRARQNIPALSTCAGAWRYLIGDVIKFTSLEECEIIITGRTKHFLSLCGEHLSVDRKYLRQATARVFQMGFFTLRKLLLRKSSICADLNVSSVYNSIAMNHQMPSLTDLNKLRK